ncbi:MAG: hypothetical protein AAF830_03165 [Pseudomonadota bacterium]
MSAETRHGAETESAAPAAPPLFLSGTFSGKFDSKGRVILPPAFRQQLSGTVYGFPSFTEEVVMIGDQRLRARLVAAAKSFEAVDAASPALTAFQQKIVQDLQPLSVDDAGRAVLSQKLKDHARLNGALVFAGRDHHFVLAREDVLQSHDDAAAAFAREFGEAFAARMRPTTGEGS